MATKKLSVIGTEKEEWLLCPICKNKTRIKLHAENIRIVFILNI